MHLREPSLSFPAARAPSRAGRLLAAALCGLTLSVPALASGLRVTPLRLDLTPERPQQSLTVQNISTSPLPVEIRVVRWTQDEDGADRYEPSEDLFVAPPISELAPRSEQRTRVVLLAREIFGLERAYRIYVEELPRGEPGAGTGMQFRMRLGIPVFARPADAPPPQPALARLADGRLRLRNAGGIHLKVLGMEWTASRPADGRHREPDQSALAQATSPFYLLPGAARTVAPDGGGAVPAQARWLHLVTDWYGGGDVPEHYGADGHFWLPLPDLVQLRSTP